MNEPIIPRETVAQGLSISPQVLIRYEELGLVRCIRSGDVQGYEPSQVRRIWSIVSYQRDLGVNLAGVEVILQLRDHMTHVHRHLSHLAKDLRDMLDAPDRPS